MCQYRVNNVKDLATRYAALESTEDVIVLALREKEA